MADNQATGGTRALRFGVVTPLLSDVPAWHDQVRRIADSGYSTLLVPDVPQWQPVPAASLAVAAALTDLRVGSWVYASPLRPPSSLAWEAHSLSVLTEGRFEFGIGTGRPGIEDELRERGLPPATRAERVSMMGDAVTALRGLDGPDLHTPVVMAARGPRTRALAVEFADTVNFASIPSDSRADIMTMATDLRAVRDIELALHVPVVGDLVAPFMAGPGTDAAALHAADSILALPGDPKAAVEEVLRRREEGGFSYVVVGSNAAEAFAPVVAELAGH